MSRRTRRMRRRLHRRDVRGEPLTLIVDDRYPGETLEALVRWICRYRSELAPLVLGATTGVTAAFLHPRFSGWAPVVALLALVGSAVLWCVERLTSGLRGIERAYAAAVTGGAGLWLAAATTFGPATAPLPVLLVLGTLAAAMPWWWHRRRRARVRVERTLEAWPDIAEAIGLKGSRVMSAVVDLWGWRARIGLRRGQTAADVIAKASALESGLGARPGSVRVEPDPARADHCLIRVLNADPHARAIAWPASTSDTEPHTITAPIPLGLFEDASPVAVTLAHRHALIGGVVGAGKSGILNAILASLTGCPDVVLWGVDLKGGMELRPWAPCLDRLATTPAQATELLADSVAILNTRAPRLADAGQRLWQPSPAEPALVVVIDEYAELSDDAPPPWAMPTPPPGAAGPWPSPCSWPPNDPLKRPWAPARSAHRWTSECACGSESAETSTLCSAKACSPPDGTPTPSTLRANSSSPPPNTPRHAEPAPTCSPTPTSPP